MSENVAMIENVIAVITIDKDRVEPGGAAPVFYASDENEMEKLALYISRITLGMAHDLENGVCIIVKH